MPLSILFWVLYVLLFITTGYLGFRPNGDRWGAGTGLIALLLFGILGWATFGAIVQGR